MVWAHSAATEIANTTKIKSMFRINTTITLLTANLFLTLISKLCSMKLITIKLNLVLLRQIGTFLAAIVLTNTALVESIRCFNCTFALLTAENVRFIRSHMLKRKLMILFTVLFTEFWLIWALSTNNICAIL